MQYYQAAYPQEHVRVDAYTCYTCMRDISIVVAKGLSHP